MVVDAFQELLDVGGAVGLPANEIRKNPSLVCRKIDGLIEKQRKQTVDLQRLFAKAEQLTPEARRRVGIDLERYKALMDKWEAELL